MLVGAIGSGTTPCTMWVKPDSGTWDREGRAIRRQTRFLIYTSVHAKTVVTQRRVGGVQSDGADLQVAFPVCWACWESWKCWASRTPAVRAGPFSPSWRNLANVSS